MANNLENYRQVRNWKAGLPAGAAALFGFGAIGEVFSGDVWGSAASLFGVVTALALMGHVNQSGNFFVQLPKPVAPKQNTFPA